MRLEDAKIIVTGGAQGLGRHFAKRIVEAGGQVIAGDVNEEGLRSLAEESKGDKGKLFVRRLDVADEADIGSFVEHAHTAMGGLNGLVNNAGILKDGLLVKKDRETGQVTKLSRADWQRVIDVNLTGATLMVRDVVAKMAETNTKGVVVNMSSIARHGNRGQSNYAAAKAALATNTKTWVARVRALRHSRRCDRPGDDRDAHDAGDEPEGPRRARRRDPRGSHRASRRHLARGAFRDRVRVLQRTHHRRRRRPLDVNAARRAPGATRSSVGTIQENGEDHDASVWILTVSAFAFASRGESPCRN